MMLDYRFLTTADQLFALFPAGFKLTLNHLFLHIFTLPSLCRCWACSAPVSYCAGEVTTRRTSCWSPLTTTHEGSVKAEPRRRAEKIKKERHRTFPHQIPAVVIIQAQAHLAQIIIQQRTLTMWSGWAQASKVKQYLFTCFLSNCYFFFFFF